MQKRLDTGKWKGDYRFRYKKDDKIFGSDDKKSWYSINPKLDGESEPDDEMEKILDGFQQHIRMMYPDADKLIIKGGLPELLVKCKTKGWMHIGGDGRHFELLQGGKK